MPSPQVVAKSDVVDPSTIATRENDLVVKSIYPILERLQKLMSSMVDNVTAFHQAQQYMTYLSATVKQQEDKIRELKTSFELMEVERNETICMRVELQMLRESSVKSRSDQERLRFYRFYKYFF